MMDDKEFYDDYTYYFPKGVIITGITTASISTVSSILILSVIVRTKARFSTVYHRILTCISVADLLASIPQMLSTLPMPKDQPFEFELPSYGSHLTCQIQGLSFMLGFSLVFWFSFLLNIFYLCILKYEMQETTFKKWIEFPGYIIGVPLLTIASAVSMWGKFNPAPIDPFCATRFDPEQRIKKEFDYTLMISIGLAFGCLFLCMGLILWSFYLKKKKIEEAIKKDDTDTPALTQLRSYNQDTLHEKKEMLKHCQETSRKVTIQALMYIFSFIAVILFAFIEWLINRNYVSYTPSHSSRQALAILRMLFQPLQGFFNMLIFLHQKVLAIQMNDAGLYYFEAMRMAVFHPNVIDHDEGLKISNLELLLGDITSDVIMQLEIVGELQNPYSDQEDGDDAQQVLQNPYSDQEDGDDAQQVANQQELDQVSTGLLFFDQTGMSSTNSQQLSAFTRLIADEEHNTIGEGEELDHDSHGSVNGNGKEQSNLCLETDAPMGSSDEKHTKIGMSSPTQSKEVESLFNQNSIGVQCNKDTSNQLILGYL